MPFTEQHEGQLLSVDHDLGHGGEWVAAQTLLLAARLGYQGSRVLRNIAWGATTPHHGYRLSDSRAEQLFDAADDVADWLTEHHAPRGFCFDFSQQGDLVLRRAAPPRPVAEFTTRGKPALAQIAPARIPPGFHGQPHS
jgi:hypothetical protein